MQGMRVKNHKNNFNQNWSSVRSKGGAGQNNGYPAFWEKPSASASTNESTKNVIKFPAKKNTAKVARNEKTRSKKAA